MKYYISCDKRRSKGTLSSPTTGNLTRTVVFSREELNISKFRLLRE